MHRHYIDRETEPDETGHSHRVAGYTELAGLGEWDGDELGFFDPLSLVSAGAGLVGNLLGGGKKKDGNGASAAGGAGLAIAPLISEVMGKIVGEDEIKAMVRELIATVPPPVQQQVRDVIKSVQAEGGSLRQAENKLVANIEAKFMPAITKAMAALKFAQTQRTATSEHRGMIKDASRWERSRKTQKELLKRVKKLGAQQSVTEGIVRAKLGDATVLSKSHAALLGGKPFIDLLASKRRK